LPTTDSRRGIVAALAAGSLILGCGGGGDALESSGSLVRMPTTPRARDCAPRVLSTTSRARGVLPRAGTYVYETNGSSATLRDGKVTERLRLAKRSKMIVTAPARVGRLRCFRVQRRLADAVADTVTVVVRGSEAWTTGTELQAGGDLVDVLPRPPVRTLASDDLEWSGAFGGRTRGVYRASVLGRRRFTVGHRRVRAIGVDMRLAYRGDVDGTQRSVIWSSLEDNVALTERVTIDRRFGLDRHRIHYTSELSSLRPRENP